MVGTISTLKWNASAHTITAQRIHPAATIRCLCSSPRAQPDIPASQRIPTNMLLVIIPPQSIGTTSIRTAYTSPYPIPDGARHFGASFTVSGFARRQPSPMSLTDSAPRIFCRCLQNTTSQPSVHRLQCIVSSSKKISQNTIFLLSNMQQQQVKHLTPKYSISSKKQQAFHQKNL